MLQKSVTLSQILDKISEYHVFKRYAPPFVIGILFRGDILRDRREKHPSANIFYDGKRWRYKDYGVGTFSCWDYMMAKFNISFTDALSKVDLDFGLGFGYDANIAYRNKQYDYKSVAIPEEVKKQRQTIQIRRSQWSQKDIDYWSGNGWTGLMVKRAKIVPIEVFYLKDDSGDLIRFNRNKELAYSYEYYRDQEGIFQRKIYSPYRDYGKWYSNIDRTTVQGIKILPKNGNILFITSSLKDCGQTSRIFGHWNAIAGNNELSFIPLDVFYKLRKRFKRIILWLDNDESGIKSMQKWSKMYNLDYIHNPIGSPKDQTALWRELGGNGFNRIMNQQLNLINN